MKPSALEAVPVTGPATPSSARNLRALLLGALLVVAFWPILRSMYGSWLDEYSYMEHGILVLPAAAYMAWTKRTQLAKTPVQPSGWAILLLVWGALQATLGTAAQWVWFTRMSFLVSTVGAIAAVYGWSMIRQLMYPLGTLILMIAPPSFVFERLTLSLQLLASSLGEVSLEALGYSVMREGNVLDLVGITLSVEEACSGIRSLLSILFMCVLYNFFFVRGNVSRTLILVLSIPVAILGNSGRIIATGIASQYNRSLVQGTAHEAFGYVSVVIAGIGCVVVHLTILQVQKMWRARHA